MTPLLKFITPGVCVRRAASFPGQRRKLLSSSPLTAQHFFTIISFAAMIASVVRGATKANHKIISN
jgi:hypothetical protein